MAYDAPRPYRPQELKSPESYDSLRPPPSVTQWSTPGSSGYSSPAGSSVALGSGGSGAPSSRGAQQAGERRYGAGGAAAGPPAHPSVLQKRERGTKHEALDLGGTGYIGQKEDPRLRRKRITLIVISGLVVCAIIALVVVGCKGLL
ncbi:hypothetical protein JCM3775_006509 [Rhodotorula graminis]